jgi:hypothetical protein
VAQQENVYYVIYLRNLGQIFHPHYHNFLDGSNDSWSLAGLYSISFVYIVEVVHPGDALLHSLGVQGLA